jgi:hypothetical protein
VSREGPFKSREPFYLRAESKGNPVDATMLDVAGMAFVR